MGGWLVYHYVSDTCTFAAPRFPRWEDKCGITALRALGVGLVRNPRSIHVGLSLHERLQSCVLSSQLQVHLINRALFLLISFSFPNQIVEL